MDPLALRKPKSNTGIIIIVILFVLVAFVVGYVLLYKAPVPEAKAPTLPACPKSIMLIKNTTSNTYIIVQPGTYDITRDNYEMTVYPPLQVSAYGPTGDLQQTSYLLPDGVECGEAVKLVLDKEKNYNAVSLAKI